MTNIFDNVESLTIDGKEVESIVIGEATLYEKPSAEPATYDVTFTIMWNGEPATGPGVTFNGETKYPNANGEVVFNNIPEGTYSITSIAQPAHTYKIVGENSYTIDSTHTSFTVEIGF